VTVRCTRRSLNDSDDTRCCINTIWPPEDEQDIVRNMYMYRIVINVLKICASSWSLAKVMDGNISLKPSWNFRRFRSCRENQNTNFIFSISFSWKSSLFFFFLENTVQPYRPQMTIRRMRCACWITKASVRHSEYNSFGFSTVTVVTWTRLSVTFYIACPVSSSNA
jgi:hypothetical protein